jgi:ABC-type uncharacterized transport system substrate-binding protein
MMRRRDLVALAWAAAMVPARVFAADPFVIGYLGVASGREYAPYLSAFRQALAENGYAEGQKLRIEYRWADGRYEKLPNLVADLVSQKVDLIVASGGNASALAAKHATQTIPIVFVTGGDPVGNGVVSSLARPGGNLTGINMLTYELGAKRFELLSAMLPDAKVISFLTNPNNPRLQYTQHVPTEIDEAARTMGLTVSTLTATTEGEIDSAFAQLSRLRVDGLVLDSDAFFNSRREQILALASRYRVPGIYEWREFTGAGGLMSYGTNLTSVFRLAATYCTKILDGAKPADLPVQQPTDFELVVNLKTAKALSITVPQSLLARADEVIE